jgi:hypothetical protein
LILGVVWRDLDSIFRLGGKDIRLPRWAADT